MENRRENFPNLLTTICGRHRTSKDDPHQLMTKVRELFSLIRVILLIGESINYMTSAQKYVDWLLSLATFAQLGLSCKFPWFGNYYLQQLYTERENTPDLTMPGSVKVAKSKALLQMVPSLVQEKTNIPPVSHRGNVPFSAFSEDLQTDMTT